ncbi:MAG: poly-gamma-glutamate hydrolase family protein [Elusimicrobiota bacterium]
MKRLLWLLLAASMACVPAANKRSGSSKSKDLYPDFASLTAAREAGSDFRVLFEDRRSSVAVFAIHGGNIEPGTSQAALAVAGGDWSYYLFECLGTFEECRSFHVTSARYDDPAAVALAASSLLGVSLHGSRDTEPFVCVGGANAGLRASMAASLLEAGIQVEEPCKRLPGAAPKNIVNRAREGGVQLEISVPLCRKLEADEGFRREFGAAVRRGMKTP